MANETRSLPAGRIKRFWLEHGGQNIELRRGTLLVGRSSGCHLVLEDSMVSRRHAELLVTEDSVTVKDLGSVNGIYVNARRVEGSQRMKEGDTLQIGQREFVLRSFLRESMPISSDRQMVETLHGESLDEGKSEDQTHVGDVFDVLGSVADKVLAMDRGEEAERILSGVLQSILREAKEGREVPAGIAERAAAYAVRIAWATSRASWLDYVIELYTLSRRVLPSKVVDQMYDVVRKARGMHVASLRAYVAVLEEHQATFGPAERFVLQRIAGLERVVLS
ncbi:MAG TPA: FHA domain-containing protein [Polyangiaceae bacterium]|nr:FHA domain-containing protein [Polyangiaceae bacterium]